MKKIKFFAMGAFATLLVSCNGGGVSTNVKLTDAKDTLAYAYGLEIADRGLSQYLAQMGILSDTAQIRFSYNYRMQAETDSLARLDLAKQMKAEIDSAAKANKKNLNDFLSGLQEGINTSDKKAAYMRGVEVGNQLKGMSENMSKQAFGADSDETLDKYMVLAGVVTSLKKEKALVENPGIIVEAKMQEIQEAKIKEEHGDKIEAENKFLAENKTQEGVQTLPSGLQYKVIKEGTGEKPTATDQVKVHYEGKLLDGTVFDSSIERGEPSTFAVNRVVSGWTEALQQMPVGSKWILYIPSELGYGSRGTGGIPPFSTLIFEVELLEIIKK